jgi:hypothetical protein
MACRRGAFEALVGASITRRRIARAIPAIPPDVLLASPRLIAPIEGGLRPAAIVATWTARLIGARAIVVA